MIQSAFYFRMIEQTTNRFIDTGVMNYLLKAFLKEKINIKKSGDPPKVLTLEDLSFGFNIWIGFCIISIVSFILESLFALLYIQWKRINIKKINRYAKIYPAKHVKDIKVIKLKPQTRKHFRVKKTKQIVSKAINLTTTPQHFKESQPHSSVNVEEDIFGEPVTKLQNFPVNSQILNSPIEVSIQGISPVNDVSTQYVVVEEL
jgi:hypothetical protein